MANPREKSTATPLKRAGAVAAALLLSTALVPAGAFEAIAQPLDADAYDQAVQALADAAQASLEREQASTFVNEHGRIEHIVSAQGEPAAASNAAPLSDLPASYTAPYTSVKNQGAANSCWAFAATASLESAYLVQQGISDAGSDAVDFSEAQVVYATFNGKTQDGTPYGIPVMASGNDHHIAEDGLFGYAMSGGWELAAATLADRRGASYENDIPFLTPETGDDLSVQASLMADAAAANYDLSRVTLGRAASVALPSSIEAVGANGRQITRGWDEGSIAEVKQTLFDTGAVSASLYMESDPSSPYYHIGDGGSSVAPDGAWYRHLPNYWTFDADDVGGLGQSSLSVNHDVAIVGWDDSYSRWNFATNAYDFAGNPVPYDEDVAEVDERDGLSYIVPIRDGAWIIKNSWGTRFEGAFGSEFVEGDDGIFHISYCEKTLCNAASLVPAQNESGGPAYQIVHQYDGLQAMAYDDTETEGIAGANVFHADGAETLEAAGIWVPGTNAELDIAVYTDLADPADPESGTLALRQHESIATNGWYSIDLDTNVPIGAGSSYSIVVSGVWGGEYEFVPVEIGSSLGQEIVRLGQGESFIKAGTGEDALWVDAKDVADTLEWGVMGNLCVKALANPAEESEPSPDTEEQPETPQGVPNDGEDSSDGGASSADENDGSDGSDGVPSADGASDAGEESLGRLASTGDPLEPAAAVAAVGLVAGSVAIVASRRTRGTSAGNRPDAKRG